jgi:hypothetical protein
VVLGERGLLPTRALTEARALRTEPTFKSPGQTLLPLPEPLNYTPVIEARATRPPNTFKRPELGSRKENKRTDRDEPNCWP